MKNIFDFFRSDRRRSVEKKGQKYGIDVVVKNCRYIEIFINGNLGMRIESSGVKSGILDSHGKITQSDFHILHFTEDNMLEICCGEVYYESIKGSKINILYSRDLIEKRYREECVVEKDTVFEYKLKTNKKL